jgi:O-antigen/teichoic acid export membrane protein
LQAVQIPFFNKIKSPHIKKYAANTGWLFADNFLKQAINLIVGVFLARYLNPEGLGSISYASTYMQLLNPIAMLGINAIAIKEFVNNKEKANTVIGTTFYLKLISSFTAFAILVLCAIFLEDLPQMRYYIVIVGLSYLLYPFQVIDFYFQSNLKSKYTVLSQQIATVIAALLKILGMIRGYSIEYFVWLILAELIVSTICQIIIYKLKIKLPKWSFNRLLAFKMLKESFPIIFTGFFIVIYMRVDQLMIQKMLDTKSLGNFSAAIKLSEAFYVVPGIIAGSLFPAIINGLKISREEYLNRMQRLYSVFTLLCLIVSLGVIIFGDLIVSILYGDAYTQTSSVLKVHFCNSVFVFFGVAYSQAFIVEGMQKFTTINTIVGAVINIVLNFYFIPKIGIVGSAIATLIAQFYSGFFCLLLFPKTRVHFKLMINSFNFIKTIRLYSTKIRTLNNE